MEHRESRGMRLPAGVKDKERIIALEDRVALLERRLAILEGGKAPEEQKHDLQPDDREALVAQAIELGVKDEDGKPYTKSILGRMGLERLKAAIEAAKAEG